MIWKLALAVSVAVNIAAVLVISGAIENEGVLIDEIEAKERRIFELESRPEAITTLTAKQFETFMEAARAEAESKSS